MRPKPVHPAPLVAPPARPLALSAQLASVAGVSGRYLSGRAGGGRLVYEDLAAFVWWDTPKLDDPVRVRLGESLEGIFVDASLELAFLPNVDHPLGSRYRIGDELDPATDLYSFTIAARTESGGLITYQGETLLAQLDRAHPQAAFVLLAGHGGVPDRLTPREALRRLLEHFGIPGVEPLPEFLLRTPEGGVTPELEAFVLEPDADDPRSLYEILQEFLAPFSGYRIRVDASDRLEVAAPAWVDDVGVSMSVYRRGIAGTLWRFAARRDWIPSRPPVARVELEARGQVVTGFEGKLEPGVPIELADPGSPLRVSVLWDEAERAVTMQALDPAGTFPFDCRGSFAPAARETEEHLVLTLSDLSPDGETHQDTDSVVNRATVTVQGYKFEPDQQVMEPSALILRGPEMQAANLARSRFGPATAPTEAPEGFREILNREGTHHVAFWPVADGVIAQPGAPLDLVVDVEEHRDVWWSDPPLYQGSELNYQTTVEVQLPLDGKEHRIYTCRYAKYGIGGTSASGAVYARWVGGSEPGVEVRVQHQPGMSGWNPISGQRWHIYSLLLKLNGLGLRYQRTRDRITGRFGYQQADRDALPGLGESQELYGERERRVDTGMFQVSEATALAMARAIVEDNYNPKLVHTLHLVPSGEEGYRVKPWHVGRTLRLPSGDVARVTSWLYEESHTPLASESGVIVEAEVGAPLARERSARRHFGHAAYRVAHYATGGTDADA